MELSEIEVNRSFVQGKRFIVLEDDALVSQAMQDLLEKMGAAVQCYDNAEDALQQSNIVNADCYIVDYMLPGNIDGINFLSLLHQRLHKPVCAVMMSGNTSSQFIKKAEFFNWPLLHKPANVSQLIALLSEQYGRRI